MQQTFSEEGVIKILMLEVVRPDPCSSVPQELIVQLVRSGGHQGQSADQSDNIPPKQADSQR